MRITFRAAALSCLILATNLPTNSFAEDPLVARNQLIVEWNPAASTSVQSGTVHTFQIEPGSFEPASSISNATLVEMDELNHIGPVRSSAVPVTSSREAAACHNLISSGLARACSPNFYVKASLTPNDSERSQDYWHDVIDSYGAWDVSTSSDAVVVGVVDTGINYNHPDLAENMWRNPGEIPGNGVDDDGNGVVDDVFGLNAINDSGDPFDDSMHGSHCAGIIGARGNNGQGVAGVAWQAKLMALKFLSADGGGWTMDAIQAFDYAVMMKRRGVPIRVLSNSWGGGWYSKLLEDAIQRANDEGIIVVAAAGNSSTDNDILPSYPANHTNPNVISVAASNSNNELTGFSCFGPTTVHIAAPGSMINSTVLGDQYEQLSGTSMATPFVAGALALLLAHEPNLSVSEAIQRLYETGVPYPQLEGTITTGRLLNVNNLIRNIRVPDPEPGQVCSYSLQEIPYEDRIGRNSAPIVIPDSNGFPMDHYVALPFDFPFYTSSYATMIVGMNGIVHFTEPRIMGALTWLPYAPLHSIAAMHTYMFTWFTPAAPLGVRVNSSAERVDVRWELPNQWNQLAGNITATLSLFPDGTIEKHIDIPNNRVAGTLLYGSLVGMRDNNVANSMTISRNGLPHVMVGRRAFRIRRPTQCHTERRVVVPTPTPSPTPTPWPTPIPPPPTPGPNAGQASLLLLELNGKPNTTLQMGTQLRVSLMSSHAMVIPLKIIVDGAICGQTASISLVGGREEFTTRVPRFPYRVRRISIGYQMTTAVARIKATRGKPRTTSAQFEQACKVMAAALQKP